MAPIEQAESSKMMFVWIQVSKSFESNNQRLLKMQYLTKLTTHLPECIN